MPLPSGWQLPERGACPGCDAALTWRTVLEGTETVGWKQPRARKARAGRGRGRGRAARAAAASEAEQAATAAAAAPSAKQSRGAKSARGRGRGRRAPAAEQPATEAESDAAAQPPARGGARATRRGAGAGRGALAGRRGMHTVAAAAMATGSLAAPVVAAARTAFADEGSVCSDGGVDGTVPSRLMPAAVPAFVHAAHMQKVLSPTVLTRGNPSAAQANVHTAPARESPPLIVLDADASPQPACSRPDEEHHCGGRPGNGSMQPPPGSPPFDAGSDTPVRSRSAASAIDLGSAPSTAGCGAAAVPEQAAAMLSEDLHRCETPLGSPEAPAWSPPAFEDECMLVTPVTHSAAHSLDNGAAECSSGDESQSLRGLPDESSLSSGFVAAVSAVRLPGASRSENAPPAAAQGSHAVKRLPTTPCSASLQPPLVRAQGCSDSRLAGVPTGAAAPSDTLALDTAPPAAASGRAPARAVPGTHGRRVSASPEFSEPCSQRQLGQQATVVADSPLQRADSARRELVDLTL